MEIDEEVTDYMDEDLTVLMQREEGIYWEPPAIVEATTEIIKTVKLVTLANKINTVELVTPAKNIISVPIVSICASISILVKSVCDSFPVEFDLVKSIESIENSITYNMISDSAFFWV